MDGQTDGNRTDIIISTSNEVHAQDCGILFYSDFQNQPDEGILLDKIEMCIDASLPPYTLVLNIANMFLDAFSKNPSSIVTNSKARSDHICS